MHDRVRGWRRPLRVHQAPVAALAAVILLTGLTACDAGGNPELDHLREQTDQGVEEAWAKVSDAAATTERAVRHALDAFGEQIDRLTTQIDGA